MGNYEEKRRLSSSTLRELCIEHDWYTQGTNSEYDHLLLDLAGNRPHLDTAGIIAIAEDIAAHSDLKEGWTVEGIAYEVARACSVTFHRGLETPPAIGCLDGTWSNDACVGYAIMAMRRAGLPERGIREAAMSMWYCFDDAAVEDAAAYYRTWQG